MTATVTGGTATTYFWTFNGTAVWTGSTYTVPSTAKTGDIITVRVTDANGNQATANATVSGLTIAAVEPTTAAGWTIDDNNNPVSIGYKYVRIFFSEPLDSLDKSDVEIRQVKTRQLFSIESVELSKDKTFADVVLSGSYSGDGTTFLQPNEPYAATVTHSGLTDTLEFELPANAADKVVVAVDVANNKIVTKASNRSNETGAASTFDLGLSYTGNLGQLIGRTVNYSYNADDEILDFTVQDEAIVIDTVKFYAGSDNTTLADDYFETQGENKTKYYLENDNKSSKNATMIYAADKVEAAANTGILAGFYTLPGEAAASWHGVTNGTTYGFAKLILNPTGTVARAFLLEDVPTFLKVADVDDKTVLVDSKTSLDLDGYTVIDAETSDLLAPDALAASDNVFYSIASKFAYRYNESVSGEMDNVIKEKLDLDGTTYTWKGGKYYDEANDKYVDLKAGNDAESTAAQDYLNSLEPDDVELQLKMNGNIAYVIGEVVGAVTTTTMRYIMTEEASMAKVGFNDLIKFPVSDGTTSSTLTIDPFDLKSYGGKAGKTTKTPNDGGSSAGTFYFDFTAADDAAGADGEKAVATFAINTLADVTFAEDGSVIGIAPVTTTQVVQTSNDTTQGEVTNDAGTVDKDITFVRIAPYDTGDTFKMNPSTNVWVFVTDAATAKADSVKKMAFGDYTLLTKDLKNNTVLKVYENSKDDKVKDLVIVQADKATTTHPEYTAFQTGETTKVKGFVTDVKQIRKSDGTEVDVLKSVTIQLPDGSKVTYEGDGSCTDLPRKNQVWELEYYKSNETVKAATTKEGDKVSKSIYAQHDYSDDTLTTTDGWTLKPDEDCLILEKYTEGTDTKYRNITISKITGSNNGWAVDFWTVSSDTLNKAAVVNFVIVTNDGSTLAGAQAAIAAAKAVVLAAPTITDGDAAAKTGAIADRSATACTGFTFSYTMTPAAEANDVNAEINATTGAITATPGTTDVASTTKQYKIVVRATKDGSWGEWAWSYSVTDNTDKSLKSNALTKAAE